MKTLLNKKLAIVIILSILCFRIVNAQVADHFPQRKPYFHYIPKNKQPLDKPDGLLHNDKVPCLKKQNILGGTGNDFGNKIIPTNDGGFIICGGTYSNNGDFHTKDTINGDAFIAKYNKFRHLEWTKTIGGSGNDYFNDIIQTFDGGYISTGVTTSTDGNVNGNHGGNDVFLVKFSALGNVQWQKCFGGSGDDFGNVVLQNFYGGYAIAGFTSSNDGNVSGNHNTNGDFDAWLVQLDPKGNLLYQHCYGGSGFDDFIGMVSSDGGSLILQGSTLSNDGDVSGFHGGVGQDAWAIKVNAFGKIIWEKTIGGSNDDEPANFFAKTNDGNVVIDGYSFSDDGDINGKDTLVSFITKLNSNTGNIIWSKSYDRPKERGGFGIFATKDGGVVETGAVGVIGVIPTFDVLVSKFDKNGNEEWYKTLGGSDYDIAVDGGYESPNGNLNILCLTSSTDGDIKNNHGEVDTWLIKLGPCGEKDEDDLPGANSQNTILLPSKINTVSLSNYPNPISNSSTISFSLPQSQKVFIQVFDGDGKLLKTIADEQMQAGIHQLKWNAADVSGGIYYLKFSAGNYVETKKLSVIK